MIIGFRVTTENLPFVILAMRGDMTWMLPLLEMGVDLTPRPKAKV